MIMDPYIAIAVGIALSRGPLEADGPNMPIAPTSTLSAHNFMPTGRLAVGLHKDSWDIELGSGPLSKRQISRDGGQDVSGYNINESEWDVRARYWLPVSGNFSVYGEGGAAAVRWTAARWTWASSEWPCGGGWVSTQGWAVAPQIGLGAGYDLSKKWKLTAGATQTFNANNVDTLQVMVGTRYSF